MKKLLSAEAWVQVPFYDLDPMDVVWHGNHIKYFELARRKLLEKIGYDYPQMKTSGFSWPVIDLHARYIAPIQYGMNIKILATLEEYEIRLNIRYLITCDERRLCRGRTVQVAVEHACGVMCLTTPQVLRDGVLRALAEA